MSRRHALIRVSDDGASLEDCGGKNGTYVDGRRVEEATPLRDGMEIRLGKVLLVVREVSDEGSTATATPT